MTSNAPPQESRADLARYRICNDFSAPDFGAREADGDTGDIFGSGTGGLGCLAELWGRGDAIRPSPLALGDEVRLEVEGIGVRRNSIVAGVEPVPFPRARGAVR